MPLIDLKRPRTVIDTETTGLSVADGERMVSIGAVRGTLQTGWTSKASWIVDTAGRQSAPEALAIHRISMDHPDRVAERVALEGLRSFLDGSVAVFQNAAFDIGFLDAACDRCSMPRFDFDVEDTMVLARERFPNRQVNLDSLVRLLGLENSMSRLRDERHTVIDDCILTFEVWRRLASPDGLELVNDMKPAARFGKAPIVETIPMEW